MNASEVSSGVMTGRYLYTGWTNAKDCKSLVTGRSKWLIFLVVRNEPKSMVIAKTSLISSICDMIYLYEKVARGS